MRSKSLFRGDPEGKTGWELLRDWWRGDEPPKDPLAGFPNPLELRPGDAVELSLGRATRWEVEGLFAFFDGKKSLNTRYELSRRGEQRFLEDYTVDGERSWLELELVEELALDEELLAICEEDETLDHTLYDEANDREEVTTYHQEGAGRYRALYFEREVEQPVSAEVLHFHYFSEEKRRYLTVEVWPDEGWMRFFVGRDFPARSITALGTGL